jgi:hypothetical protein
MGRHGASRVRAGPDAHLLVMETDSTLSGLEPLLSIEALAEYAESDESHSESTAPLPW